MRHLPDNFSVTFTQRSKKSHQSQKISHFSLKVTAISPTDIFTHLISAKAVLT